MTRRIGYNIKLITEISRLKSDLDALLLINVNYLQRLDEKFRLEFNYNSNHIKGKALTYGQTVMVLK